VALVRFERPESFDFKPGQFVTLSTAGGLSRSYSIASQATEETHFDIHVRRVNQGRFSTWFHDEAKAGDILWLEGPKGDCYYNPSDPHEPLTLIGTGTGIAPLYAIAIDALAQRHFGQITIYHGALTQDRLYFVDELKALDASYENISYLPCVVEGMTLDGIQVGELSDIVLNNLPEPKSQRVYLCGDPGIVRLLKKKIFLAGTSLAQIYSDPFVGTNSK
jgi:ferredoxin-NADP reductase